MDLGIADKVAWVTGASGGLGRAIATSLAREGAAVAISARNKDTLEAAAEEIGSEVGGRCIPLVCDVADSEAIERAAATVAEALGPIDILVSNAGGPPPGGIDDFDDVGLQSGFELTAASAWRLTKAVLPAMKERGSGVLVYLTSSSVLEVIPNLLLSNMMRSGVTALAKTLSKELGPHGIRVVCVAPGRHATDRLRVLDEAAAARTGRSVEEIQRDFIAAIPLGRYGDPAEFGDVVTFLASERASYVSGITVLVDGAASIRY